MSLHQIIAGLLNDYTYASIVQVLNEMTKEMFDHHSRNYNEMVANRVEDFFATTVAATQSHEVDLSEEIAKQISVDVSMLGNQHETEAKPKALHIKMTKPKRAAAAPVPEEPVPTVSVTKAEEPVSEPLETVVVPPKKVKKLIAKAKRV